MDKVPHKPHHAHHSEYDIAADIEKIKQALLEASSDVKGRAGEILKESTKQVKAKSDDIQSELGSYIAEKPFNSISIAVLAGMVIGYLLRK